MAFTMDDTADKAIDELMAKAGVESRAKLVTQALAIYEALLDYQAKGFTFLATNARTGEQQRFRVGPRRAPIISIVK